MANRSLPKPKWHRYVAVAAGVAVLAGAAAVAVAAGSGGPTSGSGRTSAVRSVAATHNGAPLTAAQSGGKAPAGTAGASPTSQAGTSGPTTGTRTPLASSTLPAAGTGPVVTPGAHTGDHVSHPRFDATKVFTGLAFDACTAPSATTMSAWRAHSPYGAAAVYVGGQNRGCAQAALTPTWVSTVHSAGWQLIPIYVGAQPPCQTGSTHERIGASNAASLGTADGADAVAKASALGMRVGSAVYLDMEAYDTTNSSCVASVLTYVQNWDRALHTRGYVAGFYGFSTSSAAAVASAAPGGPDLPDALWYARYDGNASTTTGFPFAATLWTGHRRGHQYQVNVKETYGGAALTVDKDAWDAPVAVIG